MNKFLADLYGTASTVGAGFSDDTEKLAEAKLLDDFFKAEGIDVDKLSDDTIVKVAHQLFGADSAIVKTAGEVPPQLAAEAKKEGETTEEEKKEKKEGDKDDKNESEEEKVAQADFLGRVMAHAFHQEKTAIEKSAAAGRPQAQEKTASPALDVLAEKRALEMLKEAGYEVGAASGSEEKKLASAVDQRALQMLKEAGYPVE
jgi:phosphoglycolate phosphatase-like HAD superfamily hydrolase